MATRKGTRTDAMIGLLVFIGVLAVYIVTLCPTIYPGESLGAVTAATKTRFIKSVEYPVWQFLGRIFMLVSNNKAWALNLLSAVCGAASIALLYRIFARFSHTRTRDELIRFRGQPGLARYAALAAALLVALSHTFWRASVTASTHTLNALLLLAVTNLLLRYKETRKKRYFMLYGAVYAIGLANFPTMLLLFPVFLVLSILWCREVYADLITLGVTLVLAAILLGISSLSGPIGFSSNLPGYFLKPLPITRPMFDYVRWYWAQIRPVLPMGGLFGGLVWVLWLVLPTLPPVLYLAFTKAQRRTEMGRGSAISDAIFKFLGFLYTLVGVMALFDIFIGPYGTMKIGGFLVAYMVIGGWLCYMLGYWAVLFTSKPAATAAARGPRYSKAAYGVLVTIFLVLPVANFVKHLQFDKSGLAGFTVVEDFAKDTLASAASTGERAVILVSSTDGWGDLLQYVLKYRYAGESSSEIVIADLYAANVYDGFYVDKHAYLSTLFVGRELSPQSDPARDATLSDAEAVLRYAELGSRVKRIRSPKVCLTSDLDRFNPESESLDYAYELVPRGFLYLLDRRDSYLNIPAEHVAAGEELWSRLATRNMRSRPFEKWPAGAGPLVRRASKLVNDFGVYCHKHAGEKEAVEFYELALRFDDSNYAALRNLKIAGAAVDFDLDERLSRVGMSFSDEVTRDVERILGPGVAEDVLQEQTRYRKAFRLMLVHGLVRDVKLIEDFYKANPDRRARTFEFSYAIISLGALLDPEGDQILAERGTLYLDAIRRGQRPSLRRSVRALKDLQAAEPYVEEKIKDDIQYQIGEVQMLLGNARAAEEAFKKALALNPELAAPYYRLADLYSTTDRADEAIQLIEDRLEQNPPEKREELVGYLQRLRTYYLRAEDPEGFVTFAEAYARANPDQALNATIFLIEMALTEEDYERAREIADDLVANYEKSPAIQVRLAATLFAEKRYQDVLAMEELAVDDSTETSDRIRWHDLRGEAYLHEGRPVPALRELKQAYDFARQLDEGRAMPTANMRTLVGTLWFAALQAAEQTNDAEIEKAALDNAMLHQVLTERSNATEQSKLMATAAYGWTLFKIKGDSHAALALIEPALLGVSAAARPKLYYGAVLMETGEVRRGAALIKEALESELGPYEEAEAQALLEKYKDEIGEEPTEPETREETPPDEAGTPTEPGDTGSEGEETGSETEPDDPAE